VLSLAATLCVYTHLHPVWWYGAAVDVAPPLATQEQKNNTRAEEENIHSPASCEGVCCCCGCTPPLPHKITIATQEQKKRTHTHLHPVWSDECCYKHPETGCNLCGGDLLLTQTHSAHNANKTLRTHLHPVRWDVAAVDVPLIRLTVPLRLGQHLVNTLQPQQRTWADTAHHSTAQQAW
jgi:hypothetical protein